MLSQFLFSLFFFNDTATTEIYTLSLHDALPICIKGDSAQVAAGGVTAVTSPAVSPAYIGVGFIIGPRLAALNFAGGVQDRKSTRLNSSHQIISYAVFCLKKKKASVQGHNTVK